MMRMSVPTPMYTTVSVPMWASAPRLTGAVFPTGRTDTPPPCSDCGANGTARYKVVVVRGYPTVPSATRRSKTSSGWSDSTRASQYGDSNSA
jgi:hypothetical protein